MSSRTGFAPPRHGPGSAIHQGAIPRALLPALCFLLLGGFGGPTLAPAAAQTAEAPACEPSDMPLEDRLSPFDSTSVTLDGEVAKVCYGRPSARGRTMIGGDDVPHGEFWRTGANEPTVLHLTFPALVGDVEVGPGSYSLYTVPGEEEWRVYLNSSTDRWGIPIDDEVRRHEVGEAIVPRERPASHVETMTIRFEELSDRSAWLVLEWEEYRVPILLERRDAS